VSDEPKYPIREVSRVTGINSVTLRAWQRRYGLLKPARTEKGHRLFSEADIARIREIQRWLERGVAIGKVKALLEQAPETAAPVADDSWQEAMQRLTGLVNDLDQGRFDAEFNSLMSLYPVATLKQQLLLPLLRQFFRPVEAPHPLAGVLDSWLSGRLGTRVTNANQHNNLPWIYLLGAPVEPRSGMLLEAAELSASGYRVSLLGELSGQQQLVLLLSRLERLWLVAEQRPDTPLLNLLQQLPPEQLSRLGLLGPVWRSLALPGELAEQCVDGAEGLIRRFQQEEV